MRSTGIPVLLLVAGVLSLQSHPSVAASPDHEPAYSLKTDAPELAAARLDQSQVVRPWVVEMSRRVEDLIPDATRRTHTLSLIYDTAVRYDVDPVVVLALVTVESKFQPRAVSKTGALGMMQVMPFWMKEIGHPSDDLFDLPTNLAYGCAILKRYMMLSNGNLGKALADYNGGGDPQYTEKVMHQLNTRFSQ